MSKGEGHPGYCKLCAWDQAKAFNAAVNSGLNAAQALRWAEARGMTFTRQTFYKHKPHALTPENAVVAVAEQGRKALTIKKTSNVGFLEAIRDIGYSKAIEDPDKISIEHALKAAAILESRKEKAGDHLTILIGVMTGHRQPTIIDAESTTIEGTAREI